MREKIDDNLYYVEKVLRLEKEQGKMVGVVKWENWNYKNLSKEPLARLKYGWNLKEEC